MLQHGMRGVDAAQFPLADESDNIDDIQGYGVDWEAFDEDNIREHHDQANSIDEEVENPFVVGPLHLSNIQIPEANCPLTGRQVQRLEQELRRLPHYLSSSMYDLRLLWVDALQICQDLFLL